MKMMKKILNNEVFLYLVFGVATTLIYMVTRTILFTLLNQTLTAVLLANFVAILFAFATNDRFVFKQVRTGWQARLMKFIPARLSTLFLDTLLAILLVDTFPQLIGQFVQDDRQKINAIATLLSQVLVIILNYVISKLFVFTKKAKA